MLVNTVKESTMDNKKNFKYSCAFATYIAYVYKALKGWQCRSNTKYNQILNGISVISRCKFLKHKIIQKVCPQLSGNTL